MKGSGNSVFQIGKAFPDGILGEFSDAPDVQLVYDLLAVGINCLDADVQELGNLVGLFALGYKLQYLPFPGGKPTVRGFYGTARANCPWPKSRSRPRATRTSDIGESIMSSSSFAPGKNFWDRA
jgi:hypothetical protein